MTLTAARRVADAVLYEGYLLYPYRASATKNQVRWQFGVLGPVGAAEDGVGEPSSMSCDLRVDGDAELTLVLRFLQVQSRAVQQHSHDGWEDVDELVVDGARWVPYDEALPRELVVTASSATASTHLVTVDGGQDVELLAGGRLVRDRWPLCAEVRVTPVSGGVRLEVANLALWSGQGDRDTAARTSLVGTHLLVTARGGTLPSPMGTDQHRCWPCLISEDDGTDAVLVSPIVLGDHPTVAPESQGDLFDATEIDEILTLRVLTLTDAERAEARGTDPRAAEILDRCDRITAAQLTGLHGVRRGSRVLLRPSRSADAQDLFLAGMVGVVARVDTDFDGRTHVAVTLEDDPAADLYDATGRYYYFAPDEVEELT